jgi:hypothetical protein
MATRSPANPRRWRGSFQLRGSDLIGTGAT